MQRDTIRQQEPDAFEKTIDMMRKLRDLGGANGYTATGLALVSYTDNDPTIRVQLDYVPEDVRPEQFIRKMIEQILASTSVSHHVDVRSLIERRHIPVIEEDEITEQAVDPGTGPNSDN